MTWRKMEFYNLPAECNQKKGREKIKQAQQWIRRSLSMGVAASMRPPWEAAKGQEANSDYLHSSPHRSICFQFSEVSLLHSTSALATPAKMAYNIFFLSFPAPACFLRHSPKSIMPSSYPPGRFLLILQNCPNPPFSNPQVKL